MVSLNETYIYEQNVFIYNDEINKFSIILMNLKIKNDNVFINKKI